MVCKREIGQCWAEPISKLSVFSLILLHLYYR